MLSHRWRAALTLAALGSFVLGTIGFQQTIPTDGLLDSAYKSVQLFTLNSGAVDDPSTTLQIARFLAPALVAAGVLTAARNIYFRHIAPLLIHRFYREHIIVCGLGNKGLAITRSAVSDGEAVVVIEKDGRAPAIGTLRKDGVIVLLGDAADRNLLKAAGVLRARSLYAMTDDDATNCAIARIAEEAVRGDRTYGWRKRLDCVSHICSEATLPLETATDLTGRFHHSAVNALDRIAWAMVRRADCFRSVTSDSPEPPHILVVGRGHLARFVTRYLALEWLPLYDGLSKLVGRTPERLQLLLVHPRASRICNWLRDCNVEIDNTCTIFEYESSLDSWGLNLTHLKHLIEMQGRPLTHVLVCYENEGGMPQLSWAFTFAKRGSGIRVLATAPDEPQWKLIESLFDPTSILCDTDRTLLSRLDGFGETLSHRELKECVYDGVARLIHDQYIRIMLSDMTGEPPPNPNNVPWYQLPESLKQSNREHARAIDSKLERVGCSRRILLRGAEPTFRGFTTAEVEDLARREHDRWMEERLRNGWRLGEKKNIVSKTHPDIVPWEQLAEKARDIDRQFILALPAILNRAGYDIVRQH